MSSLTARLEESNVPWWLVLLEGITALVLGLLFFFTEPEKVLLIAIQVLGIYWFVKGILSIISIFIDSSAWGWKLFIGLLGIIAGIIIIQHPVWSAVLVPTTLAIVLGIEGIIIGVVEIVRAFQGGGWGVGILGVLSIILGIFLLLNPVVGGAALAILGGIALVIGGIAAIVIAFRLK